MRRILLATLLLAVPAYAQTTGDADHGRIVFNRACVTCHNLDKPRNIIGPHLVGIVGRKIAGLEGYTYSAALGAAEGNWTPDRLSAYLANPAEVYPGTKMINRLPNEADRADVIAWLAK